MSGYDLAFDSFYFSGLCREFSYKSLLSGSPFPQIPGLFINTGVYKNRIAFCIVPGQIFYPPDVFIVVRLLLLTVSRIHFGNRGVSQQYKFLMISHQCNDLVSAILVLQLHNLIQHVPTILSAVNVVPQKYQTGILAFQTILYAAQCLFKLCQTSVNIA